jgi:hypothetical protein
MIPSAAKWCVYLSSRATPSIHPSGRRRAESSATIRLLFLFYGRDSAVPFCSPLLLLSRQTAGQYWTLKSFMGGRVAASRRVAANCVLLVGTAAAAEVKDIGRKSALVANLRHAIKQVGMNYGSNRLPCLITTCQMNRKR